MNDTNEIIKTYGNRLYSAAFLVSRNPEDAEDAVQEALIRYWQSDKEFESEEHKKAWLLRVTINLAKSTRRSFWNRNRLSIEDYMETLEFSSGGGSGELGSRAAPAVRHCCLLAPGAGWL